MNINKAKKQDFLALPKNFRIPLPNNNLYKLSIFILLYFCLFYNRRVANGKK